MVRQLTQRWARMGLLVVLAGILASGSAFASSGCKKVNGKFTLQPVVGQDCTSQVGLCATGIFRGDLVGTSVFTGTSFVPTVDTPTTGVVLLTGDNLITTSDGTIQTKDAIVLSTSGAGEFAEVDTIVAATGEWAGATGKLTATGTFTAAGGEGSYSGEVCLP